MKMQGYFSLGSLGPREVLWLFHKYFQMRWSNIHHLLDLSPWRYWHLDWTFHWTLHQIYCFCLWWFHLILPDIVWSFLIFSNILFVIPGSILKVSMSHIFRYADKRITRSLALDWKHNLLPIWVNSIYQDISFLFWYLVKSTLLPLNSSMFGWNLIHFLS